MIITVVNTSGQRPPTILSAYPVRHDPAGVAAVLKLQSDINALSASHISTEQT